jgi:hypothetical protein
VRARETATAAVGPGRKMIGRGPHISEGGEGKAGWADVGDRGGGPRLGQNLEWAKVQKEILFKLQLILEIWQKFGKLHKEI